MLETVNVLEISETTLSPELAAALATVEFDGADGPVTVGDRTVETAEAGVMRSRLSGMLYEVWHAGISRDNPSLRRLKRDPAFERLLTEAVPHDRSLTEATVRTGVQDEDGVPHFTADLGRVVVKIPFDRLLGEDLPAVGATARISLGAVRPALSPGFLLVNGSHGGPSGRETDVLRLFVHVKDGEHAPGVWRAVLETLEGLEVAYRAKALSKTTSYPRRDGIVVYLPPESWHAVAAVAAAIPGLPGVADETSVYARRIASGLSMSWEPRDPRPGWGGMSFGQHRSGAVADGIMRARAGAGPLADQVAQALRSASVDPLDPARNLRSPAYPGRVES